jgi:MtN3 and saliva related transmembrane protein
MDYSTLIGIIASVGTATSMLPQLVKMVKEKKAEDISIGMIGVLFTGLCFWVYYGILRHDWIIIIANGFSLVVNLCIGILTFMYRKKRE